MATPIGNLDLPRYRMSLDNPTPGEYHDEVAASRDNGWIQRWLCGYVVFGHDDVTATSA